VPPRLTFADSPSSANSGHSRHSPEPVIIMQ
jgi:hypothetical protein